MDASNKKYRIIFCCHGNICRSPMAEFIFKDKIRSRGLNDLIYVESAAVSTEEIGNSIYPPAKRCLNAHGIPFDRDKTARQITRADYDRFDLIICMDRMNLRWLKYIIPNDPDNKVRLMMSYAGQDRDVADPWYTGDFETTYRDIDLATDALLKMTQRGRFSSTKSLSPL
ncbi:MAG: low molecular weight phosphotyrosine protein phosphatase [Bacteroidaceae bacterium]|nr:low molecular weight phosphotyrosine protein phosphatase [Bacteroidaceae bacterium]